MRSAGFKAGTEENVLIRAGNCSVSFLPHLGGKIASLRFADIELLQSLIDRLAPRTRTMSFDAGDASGWDECLPSVAACRVETAAGTVEIPDHGDLWRVAWQVVHADERSATLAGECFSLPLRLERSLELSETESGCRIALRYEVANTGMHKVPWSWAAHPLFACEPGDTLRLPASITKLRLEGSGGNRLGKSGDTVAWPVAQLANGGETDLSQAGAADSGIGDKLFTGPLSPSENWCEILRPRAGVRIRMRFDPACTPYLGLWFCYGGWPERPGTKQMCIAPEPCTAPVDSLAANGPWSRALAPGESFRWPMEVELETLWRATLTDA
jgi:galactose mutarotase-like enzyme